MKQIVDEKLYDTEKSEMLCSFLNHRIYRTMKGVLFMTYSDSTTDEQVSSTNRNDILNAMGEYFPDDYIKIFRKVEEA